MPDQKNAEFHVLPPLGLWLVAKHTWGDEPATVTIAERNLALQVMSVKQEVHAPNSQDKPSDVCLSSKVIEALYSISQGQGHLHGR